jgi:hypothetical protein
LAPSPSLQGITTNKKGCGACCSAAGYAPCRALRLILLRLLAPVQHRVVIFVAVGRRWQPGAHDGKRLPVRHHFHGCSRAVGASRCGHGVAPRAAAEHAPGAAALWPSVRFSGTRRLRDCCAPPSAMRGRTTERERRLGESLNRVRRAGKR